MGFWGRQVDDLAALGIDLSEGQERLLEEGGEGLAIRVLPDPTHFQCCSSPYFDVNEDLATYVTPMSVWVPDTPLPYDGGQTPAEFADSWWDEDWRRWPSVLGNIHDPNEWLWGEAEISLARIWSVEEATGAQQQRFERAARVWLAATDYEPLAYIAETFASGVDSGDEPCRENCKHAGEEDHECLDEGDVDNPLYWKSIWLLQDRAILDPSDPLHLLRGPPVPPFETALEDPEDRAFYDRLKRRSWQAATNALSGIRREARPLYMKHEGAFEPWY